MLGDEDLGVLRIGVCLPSLARVGRCQSLFDKVGGVSEYYVQALAVQVFSFGSLGDGIAMRNGDRGKLVEDVVNISHTSNRLKWPD